MRPGKSSPGSTPARAAHPCWPALPPTARPAQKLPRLPAWVSQGSVSCLCLLPPMRPRQTQVWQGFLPPDGHSQVPSCSLCIWALPTHMWELHLCGVGLGACQLTQPEELAPQDHKEGARPAAFCLGLAPCPIATAPGGQEGQGPRQRPAPCGPHTLARQCALSRALTPTLGAHLWNPQVPQFL